MDITRRSILLGGAAATIYSKDSTHTLRAGNVQAKLAADGGLRDLRFGNVPLVAPELGDGCPVITAGEEFPCKRPSRTSRTSVGVLFEYQLEGAAPLRIEYEVGVRALAGGVAALVQRIRVSSRQPYSGEIGFSVPRNVRLPDPIRAHFAPAYEGVARRPTVPDRGAPEFFYKMAGGEPHSDAHRLAIPLLAETAPSNSLRLALCSEPEFTTLFRLASGSEPGRFAWTHTGDAPIHSLERVFYTVIHRAAESGDFNGMYATSLGSHQAGPDWLHQVAMVHYDYLSKNGRGWFADIDALTSLVPTAKRSRVVLTIHGWYDYVGRYTFEPKHQALDKRWTAFPNVRDPRFLAHATGPRSKTAKFWGWRKILADLRPIDMTADDLRRRMKYARDRGFRCILYFGDGVNSGDGLVGLHDPSKVLAWGGWVGPETSGRTYSQNPLHPDVRAFYRNYLQALLDAFGRDVDGFVWDETFHVRAGQKGAAPYPGYADAAMMSLVAELRSITEHHDPRLAFLSSDCLEATDRDAPYALVSHGTFQDTMCNPRRWPYGLFPNHRNTLWSCNWYHQSTWEWNQDSVNTYALPVAISNGFGDDTGPSNMDKAQCDKLMALFSRIDNRRLELAWIEDSGGVKTYEEQPVRIA